LLIDMPIYFSSKITMHLFLSNVFHDRSVYLLKVGKEQYYIRFSRKYVFLDADKVASNSELAVILKRRKQILLALSTHADDSERNTVENLTYKPFENNVYHDWIKETAVDVLDVFNKVTHAQAFQVGQGR
jgi:hypothetical protein